MHTIKLRLPRNPYKIIIGRAISRKLGSFIQALDIGNYAYIITNSLIKRRYGKLIESSLKKYGYQQRLFLVKDSEASKSILTASSVIQDMALHDKKKRIFVIALGGGVIGDLSGFIASIYRRGVPYIQIPTTLLAQVDSSIGGKTALDLATGKNLVGAFYQPRLVLSDTKLLQTLTLRQIRSGLAEVIKYAAIKDAALFKYLEGHYKEILDLKPSALEFIVTNCSRIKAAVVEKDEKEERGIRTILNFGHTIGHAIEAAQSYKGYNHGEAIAIGMLCAADISVALKITSKNIKDRLENLIGSVGLPTRINKIPAEKIIKAHFHDKKFIGEKNRLVLIRGIGTTKIVNNIPLGVIRQALEKRT